MPRMLRCTNDVFPRVAFIMHDFQMISRIAIWIMRLYLFKTASDSEVETSHLNKLRRPAHAHVIATPLKYLSLDRIAACKVLSSSGSNPVLISLK